MKKICILFAAVVFCYAASAQTTNTALKDVLKNAITNAADQVTGGKATEVALTGTWKYLKPGVKLESDNALASLTASAGTTALQTKLTKAYTTVGIKAGACSYTFAADKTFTMTIGRRTLKGTYTYNSSTHAVAMTYTTAAGTALGTYTGYAYLNGTDLLLVYPAKKMLSLVNTIGSKVATLSTTVSSVMALLKNYNNLYLGMELSK